MVSKWKKAVAALAAIPMLGSLIPMASAAETNGGVAQPTQTVSTSAANTKAKSVASVASDDAADGSNGYLWLHFEATDYEKIYYGYSADGLSWRKLNNNQPLITSNVANKGIRDPHLIKLQTPDADGYKYVMIGTDLHAEGSAGSKGWSQQSQKLIVSRSKDLVNWTEAEAVSGGWDNADRMWAPEAIYDPETGDYLVYYSSKPKGGSLLGVYAVRTKDFKTFTQPETTSGDPEPWVYQGETTDGTNTGENIIDSTIVKGDDGDYYRFSTSDWSTVVDTAKTLDGKWTRIVERDSDVKTDDTSRITGDKVAMNTSKAGLGGIEGLTVFQKPDGSWIIMGDNQGYKAWTIDKLSDLKKGVAPTSATTHFPKRFRHGTVVALTAAEKQAVLQAYDGAANPVAADKSGSDPIAQYDFENASNRGEDTKGDNDLTLQGNLEFGVPGDWNTNVMQLRGGSGQYAEFPTGMFDGRDSFTLEFESKSRASSGNFFSFAIGQDNQKYIIIRLRGAQLYTAITDQTYSAEQGATANVDTLSWHKYAITVAPHRIAIYADNQLLAENNNVTVNVSDLGKNLKAYIGKSFYSGDSYWNGGIDKIKVYNYAKSEFDVVGMGAALKVKDTDQVLSQKGVTNADGSVTKTIVLDYWSDAKTGAQSDPKNVNFEYEIPDGVTVADENSKALTAADLNKKTDYTEPLKLKLTYDGRTVDYTVGVEVLNTPIRISGNQGAATGIGEKDPTGAEGWKFFADPQVVAYGGKYYIFPTTDGYANWGGHSIHAFESADLVNWEDKGTVVDLSKDYSDMIDGRKEKAWAPGFAVRDGKFYLYFSGGGMTNVAISDPAQGGTITSGYKIQKVKVESSIDPAVFEDPATGKFYLAWGQAPGTYAELNDAMTGIKADTKVQFNATQGMREGSYITARKDPKNTDQWIYYYSYSVDDTSSPNYHVRYAYAKGKSLADIKASDWQYGKPILQQDASKGILGTAHHSILQVPGTDDWYIVYHAFLTDEMRPRGYDSTHSNAQLANGNKREVRIARMTFDEDGQINTVPVTYEGVLPETTPTVTLSGGAESGDTAVGTKLTAAFNKGWEGVKYQWYRTNSAGKATPVVIDGATSASYTLTNEDAGKTVSVKAVGQSTTGVLQNAQPGTNNAKASLTYELDGDKAIAVSKETKPETVPVTGVTLSESELTLTEGDTATLSATVAPENATDKAVKWSSSDPSVATVNADGKVTAVKAGVTTITVTTLDGGKTDTVKVTVKAKESDKPTTPTIPEPGETTKPTSPTDSKDSDTQGDKSEDKSDDKSGKSLSKTGVAVASVAGAVVLLAAAGAALTIWRKRRA